MGKNIDVANLPDTTTSDDPIDLFQTHGNVKSAQIIIDKLTGRSRGFVEMSNDDVSLAAIEGPDSAPYGNRPPLNVNEARPRQEHPPNTRANPGPDTFGGVPRGDFSSRLRPFPLPNV